MMNEAQSAILKLMNDYCRTIDLGDLNGFAGLFEHGRFQMRGDDSTIETGSAEVLEMLKNVTLYDGKPNTKHVLSNVEIVVTSDRATAQSYVTVFQAVPPDFPLQAIFIGHYFDVFDKVGGNWRFTEREISADLLGDLSHHRADMA
jgi:hypothetical protein